MMDAPRLFMVMVGVQLLTVIHAGIDPYASDNINIMSTHLCVKVKAGHFKNIHIKSFTWYPEHGTEPKMLIFEGAKKYYVESVAISRKQVTLDTHHYEWNANELRSSSQKVTDARDVRAVYILYWGDYDWALLNINIDFHEGQGWHSDKTKLGVLIYTERWVYLNDIYWETWARNYPGFANTFPDFAIIHDQIKGQVSRGYVIHRDVVDGTDDMIIYDLEVWWESLRPTIHQLGKQNPVYERKSETFHHFFFLELTNSPDEVKLVHRDVRNKKANPKAQMFHDVPRGFRFGDDVYLFDSHRGCVHVLIGLKHTLKELKSSFTVRRHNIPYEIFFNCPSFKSSNALNGTEGRCAKRAGDPKTWVETPVDAPRTDAPYHFWEDPLTAWGYLILGVIIVLMIAGAAFAYFHFYVREKDPTTAATLNAAGGGKTSGTPTGKPHSSGNKKKTKKKKVKSKADTTPSSSSRSKTKTSPAKKGKKEATPKKSSTSSSASSTGEKVKKTKSSGKQKKKKKADEKAKDGDGSGGGGGLTAPWGGVGGPGSAQAKASSSSTTKQQDKELGQEATEQSGRSSSSAGSKVDKPDESGRK